MKGDTVIQMYEPYSGKTYRSTWGAERRGHRFDADTMSDASETLDFLPAAKVRLSPSVVGMLRRSAKKLKREMCITHTQALDFVASCMGFGDWAELMESQNQKGESHA